MYTRCAVPLEPSVPLFKFRVPVKRFRKCKICSYRAASLLFFARHDCETVQGEKQDSSPRKAQDRGVYNVLRPLEWLQCPHCPFKHVNRSDLDLHIEAAHLNQKTILKCAYCNYLESSQIHLDRHVIRFHTPGIIPIKRLKCPACNFKTADKEELVRHKETHRIDVQCQICWVWMKKHAYGDHLKLVHMLNPKKYAREEMIKKKVLFLCPHCDFKSVYQINLRSHIRSKHGGRPGVFMPLYKCSSCHFLHTQKSHLKRHMTVCKAANLEGGEGKEDVGPPRIVKLSDLEVAGPSQPQ